MDHCWTSSGSCIIILKLSLSLDSVNSAAQILFNFIFTIIALFYCKINKCSFSVGLLDIIKTLKNKTAQSKYITLYKDSYRNGRNTPPLIFENLKPVENQKIISTSFEHLKKCINFQN